MKQDKATTSIPKQKFITIHGAKCQLNDTETMVVYYGGWHEILEDQAGDKYISIDKLGGKPDIFYLDKPSPSIPVNDELNPLNLSALDCVNILTAKGFNPFAMEELYKALAQFIHAVEHEGEVHGRIVCAVKNAQTALHNAKTIKP